MARKYELTDSLIEAGIYLYIVFMFLTKGEGVRNVLLFGNFILWLTTLRHRQNLQLLRGPVAKAFWIFSGLTLVSVILSIDLSYSFRELKSDYLKSLILMPVLATVLADERRLLRAVRIMAGVGLFIALTGYYSYFAHGLDIVKADTRVLHTWHNRFARYLNIFLPFTFILLVIRGNRWLRAGIGLTLALMAAAVVLSSSRGGMAALAVSSAVWLLYLITNVPQESKRRIYAASVAAGLCLAALVFYPGIKGRRAITQGELSTFNKRTEAWEPSLQAIQRRPIAGWGYGVGIFKRNEPYQTGKFVKTPTITPHNSFVSVLFHQGLLGLLSYAAMIVLAIREFMKKADSMAPAALVLVACVSVILGSYVFHSIVDSIEKETIHLAFVLGMGLAAEGVRSRRLTEQS